METKKQCFRKDVFGNCILFDNVNYRQNLYSQHDQAKVLPIDDNILLQKNDQNKIRGKTIQLNPRSDFKPKVTGKLTEADIVKAKVLKASAIYNEQGLSEAEQYLRTQGLSNLIINPQYSTKDGLVVIDEKGKITVAFRGTDSKSLVDIKTDIDLFSGRKLKDIEHIQRANRQIKKISKEIAVPDEITGFSLGGATAIIAGEKAGIPTTTFNPFISHHIVNEQSRNVPHNIIRTSEDFASIGLMANNKGFNIKSVNQLETSLNPLQSHYLKNFTDFGKRRPALDKQAKQLVFRAGEIAAGEIELTSLENEGIEEFKMDGSFRGLDIKPLSQREIDTFEDLKNVSYAVDNYTAPENLVKDYLIKSLSPTNLIGGLISGIVGEELAREIDPNGQERHPVTHALLSGGITGTVGALGVARLSGVELASLATAGAVGSSAIGAGLGFAAGVASQQATSDSLARAGADRKIQESLSSAVGGAVTGGVMSLVGSTLESVGTLATIGLTEEGIAAASVALAPETAGLSLVVGTGIGTAIGLGAYAASKIPTKKIVKTAKNVNSFVNKII